MRQSAAGSIVLLAAAVAALCLSAAGQTSFLSAPGSSSSSSSALRGTVILADVATAGPVATTATGAFQGTLGVLCLGATAAMLRSSRRKRAVGANGRTMLKAEGDGKISLQDLKVGDKYTGKVTRDGAIGVYIDIGAEKDALLPRNQVPPGKKYSAGDTIEDIIIFEVQLGDLPRDRKIRVALGSLPVTFKVGDKVKGKVSREMEFGLFFSIGLSRDALCPNRMLAKKKEEYQEGEEVELTIVSIEDDKVTVNAGGVSQEEAGKPKTSISSLEVGQTVDGIVASVDKRFGVFFDIGAQKQALCYTNQLEKTLDQYEVGESVNGLKISKVNKEKDQVEVTTRSLSSEMKVGQKIEGTVMKILKPSSQGGGGVFFDAGYASDVLAPSGMLSKPVDDYTRGEVADLIVTNVVGDRVTVSTKSEEEIGTPLAKLLRGSEVVGKVKTVNPSMGIFMDIGAEKDALWPIRGAVLPKPIEDYKEGDEVTGIIITKLDQATQTLEVGSPDSVALQPEASTSSLSTLQVGMTVTGTVRSSTVFGVFVDIGAERDALYAVDQLEKPVSEYNPGEVIEGLKITEVDTARQRLAVSMRKCATDYKIGEKVDGKVAKVLQFGIFINIGASVDALAPSALLEEEPGNYKPGQELSGLTISQLDASLNRISVAMEGASGSSAATITMADLTVGDKIKAIVRTPRDYGMFVDIGLGRKDALCPNSLMDGKLPAAFKPNEEIEVFVADVDEANDRVAVSLVPITDEMKSSGSGGRRPSRGATGYIPQGMKIPDIAQMAEVALDERFLNDEIAPLDEWMEKFPGLFHLPEKEIEIPIMENCWGFEGLNEVAPPHRVKFAIPEHLRKDDAGPALISQKVAVEDFDKFGWETGIKPEIHIKYRQPPINDPNWVYAPNPSDGTPTPAMSFAEVKAQIKPWKSKAKMRAEKEAAEKAAEEKAAGGDEGEAEAES